MKTLKECRDEINEIDTQILELIKQRQEVAVDVVNFKIANNLEIFQEDREKEVLQLRCQLGRSLGLNEEFILRLFQLLMDESKNKQKEIIDKK